MVNFKKNTIIQEFFTKGHPRTLLVKKHVVLSLFYRGGDLALGFILVPLV